MSDASEIIRGRLEAGRTIADADVRALLRERDQLWQDRYDALSVHAKEGMLASEWIARTGKAERERDAARSEVARWRPALDALRDFALFMRGVNRANPGWFWAERGEAALAIYYTAHAAEIDAARQLETESKENGA